MGMSPSALRSFLEKNTIIVNKKCINKKTKKIIKACIPMHSYGHPCHIDEIKKLLKKYYIFLIEDAAESLGSFYKNKHTGTFGKLGVISFNGNKIITGGGGGCIITNDKTLANKAKHLTTTAKVTHKWDFNHDMVGYNYRMPNINAALLVAQLEKLNDFIKNKTERDQFLKKTNSNGIMTRPIWILMNKLPMFKNAQCVELKNSHWLEERVVNIPSSATL